MVKRTEEHDAIVGKVVQFQDYWRQRKAQCLLLGTGPGPEGELVRVVGFPGRKSGFTVAYVRSWVPEEGHARRAYLYLLERFGQPLKAVEVVSETGIAFHRKLLAQGILSSIHVEVPGYDPETGEPDPQPTEPSNFRP